MTDRDEFEKWYYSDVGYGIESEVENDQVRLIKLWTWEAYQAALATRPPVDVQAIEAVIEELHNMDIQGMHDPELYLLSVMSNAVDKLAAAIGAKV